MRRRVRLMSVGLLVLIVAMSAIACEKREPATSSSSISTGGGGGASPVRTAEAEATGLKGTMEARGGGSVAGTAELSPGNPGTKVVVSVKGLTAGQPVVAYIYHRSCDGSGERHGPLVAFQADGENSTSTTSFVSLALNHFAGEPHFLVIHSGTSDSTGPAVSCGELKAS